MTRRLRAAAMKLRALIRRDLMDSDLAAELDSHLAHHIDDNLRTGMSPADARRARWSSWAASRSRRAAPALAASRSSSTCSRDVRYGARALLPSRVSPPWPCSRWARIGAERGDFQRRQCRIFFSRFRSSARRARSDQQGRGRSAHAFLSRLPRLPRSRHLASGIAARRLSPMSVDAGRAAIRIWGELVTGNYFDSAWRARALGRTLTVADDVAPGSHPVLVLSDECLEIPIRRRSRNRRPIDPDQRRTVHHSWRHAGWLPGDRTADSSRKSGCRLRCRRTSSRAMPGSTAPHPQRVSSWAAAPRCLRAQAERRSTRSPHNSPRVSRHARRHAHHAHAAGDRRTLLRGPVISFSTALLAVAVLVLLLACTLDRSAAGAVHGPAARTAIKLALGAFSRPDSAGRSSSRPPQPRG